MRSSESVVRLLGRGLALLASVLLMMALTVPANATPGPPGATPRTSNNTDLVMTGTGAGQGVTGGIAPVGNPFDPLAGYSTLR